MLQARQFWQCMDSPRRAQVQVCILLLEAIKPPSSDEHVCGSFVCCSLLCGWLALMLAKVVRVACMYKLPIFSC